MQKKKQVCFFDEIVVCVNKESIWNPKVACLYENDTIEMKLDAHYISQQQKVLKPIKLEVGRRTLYKMKEEIPCGKISLNFTTMTINNQEGQYVIRLQKKNKLIDLVVQDMDQLKEMLTSKCILTTFHYDYKIDKILQNGNKNKSFFIVTKRATKEKFAIKAYSREMLSLNQSKREGLKNEIKAMRRLNQESIIHLHEVHETQNSIYLVMDLLTGGQLNQRMSATIFSKKEIKQLMYKLLKALEYLHQQKCSLQNLSSDNILLKNKESKVDIVIFNFSSVSFDWKQQQNQQNKKTLYLAPELQTNNTDQTTFQKCDIFSAGMIFSEFQQRNDLFNNLKISKAQQSLIQKMLRTNPNVRYSAQKCLSHRYFRTLLNPNDLLLESKQLAQQEEKGFQQESLQSIQSQSGDSANEDQPVEQKQFSNFKQLSYEKFALNQKNGQISLLKLVMYNSFLQNLTIKDDISVNFNKDEKKIDKNKQRNSLKVLD